MNLPFKKIAASLAAGVTLFYFELSQAMIGLDVDENPGTFKWRLTVSLPVSLRDEEVGSALRDVEERVERFSSANSIKYLSINYLTEKYTSSTCIVRLNALLGKLLPNIEHLRLEGFYFSKEPHIPSVFIDFPKLSSLHLDNCEFDQETSTEIDPICFKIFLKRSGPSTLEKFYFSSGHITSDMVKALGENAGSTLKTLSVWDNFFPTSAAYPLYKFQGLFPQLKKLGFTYTPEYLEGWYNGRGYSFRKADQHLANFISHANDTEEDDFARINWSFQMAFTCPTRERWPHLKNLECVYIQGSLYGLVRKYVERTNPASIPSSGGICVISDPVEDRDVQFAQEQALLESALQTLDEEASLTDGLTTAQDEVNAGNSPLPVVMISGVVLEGTIVKRAQSRYKKAWKDKLKRGRV